MLVGDLIKELQKFPELSTVFYQQGDEIVHLDSTHEIWVTLPSRDSLAGPLSVPLRQPHPRARIGWDQLGLHRGSQSTGEEAMLVLDGLRRASSFAYP